MKTKVLDCESFDSIYKSLEGIFEMPEKDIIAILNGFNLDHYYEKHPDFCGDPSHLFLNLFNKDFKNSSNSKTFWFHATRVFPADHRYPSVGMGEIAERHAARRDPLDCDAHPERLDRRA